MTSFIWPTSKTCGDQYYTMTNQSINGYIQIMLLFADLKLLMFSIKYLETGLQFLSHKYGKWIDWVRPVLITLYAPYFLFVLASSVYLIVKFPTFNANGETNPTVC